MVPPPPASITVTGPRSAKFRVNRFLARSQIAVARSPGWAGLRGFIWEPVSARVQMGGAGSLGGGGLQWLIWGPIATMALPRIGGYEKRQRASARKKELGSVVYKRKNTCNPRCAPSPLGAFIAKKTVCVLKIRFCNIDDEGRRGQVVM